MTEGAQAYQGTPSDELPAVLGAGRGDTTTVFVSMTGRDPEGRDAEYLRWHAMDHRPEQHRLDGLRGSLRFVSTPGCRAARAAADERHDAVDHVMAYLFAGGGTPDAFYELGGALGAGGRMPWRLPTVALADFTVAGRAAAPRVMAGADVVPWRPALGAYVLLEEGASPAGELCAVDGVAGVWWATRTDGATTTQLSLAFLDDDPEAVGRRLAPVVERRWGGGRPAPLLAAPFHTVTPFAWDRHLP